MRIHVMFAGALALAALAQPRAGSAQAAEQYRLAGDRVAIYNLAGEVTVEPGSGSDVVVEVVRGGEDQARLRVDRSEVRGSSALIVRFPDDRIVYRRGRWGGTTHMRVRIDGTFGDGGSRSGETVRIRSSGSGLEAHADLVVRVPAGRNVSVYLGVGSAEVRNVSGSLLVDAASASVTAEGVRGSLNIDTGSGSVRVRNTAADIVIDTGSGSVTVEGVRGRSLRVDTGSGSVTGSNLEAERVEIDTGSGRIDVAGVNAQQAVLDTGSGSVRLALRSRPQHVRIDTGSGGVHLAIAEGVDARLEIDTGSGGIDVDVPVRVTRSSRGRFSGVLGNGGGMIEIDTGSGGVRVTSR